MVAPIIYSVNDVSDAEADSLRQKFLQAIEQDDMRDNVHPSDVLRACTDPLWCKRYMAHGDLDLDKAFGYMVGSVKFRHHMGVNDLTQESVMTEFFEKGVISVHGRDRDDAQLLVFHAMLHERASGDKFERVKQFLVYWVEKLERQERGKRISIVLDMDQAGLASVDIAFIQFLINLFKLYYPDMLNAIIVYEMPWIMNAAWRIIKQMLPPKSHQLIKFVSRKDIDSVIAPDQCLARWGGTSTWSHAYRPHQCQMPPSPFLGPPPGSKKEAAGGQRKSAPDLVASTGSSAGPPNSSLGDHSRDVLHSSSNSPFNHSRKHPSSSSSNGPSNSCSNGLPSRSYRDPSNSPITVSTSSSTSSSSSSFSSSSSLATDAVRGAAGLEAEDDAGGAAVAAGRPRRPTADDRAPAVPLRRRAVNRRSPPAPPRPTTGLDRMLQYHSTLDIAAGAVDDRHKTKAQLSDDSGASSEDMSELSQDGADETSAAIGDLLEVTPAEEIQFASDGVESLRPLTLRCIRHGPVAFKVRTTAPERYRVRPSCGVVTPGRPVTVQVRLAPGVGAQQAVADRFLLLAAPTTQQHVPAADMTAVWKALPVESHAERRLRCALAPERPLVALVRGLGQQLDALQQRLGRQQALTQQVAQHGAATHRWLGVTLLLVAALALCNVYLLFSGAGTCRLG